MNIFECPNCESRYDATLTNPGEKFSCRCGQYFFVPDLPKQAKSWNCPSCAGSVNPEKKQCEYCGVFLSFARCPKCFSLAMIKGAKYCSECGSSLNLPAKSVTIVNRKLSCPRCKKTQLIGQLSGRYLLFGCDECGGVWIEHTVLEAIIKSIRDPSLIGALGRLAENRGQHKNHDITYLACPECHELMYRRNFASNSQIIIDECNGHGVWFDHHELAAAIEYLKSKFVMESNDDQSVASQAQLISKMDHVIRMKEEDLKMLVSEFPEYLDN